jgi:hypothetical protein
LKFPAVVNKIGEILFPVVVQRDKIFLISKTNEGKLIQLTICFVLNF